MSKTPLFTYYLYRTSSIFIRINDLLGAYRKHPEIEKNGWDYHEIPAILKRWISHRMAWDGLDFLKKREKTAD